MHCTKVIIQIIVINYNYKIITTVNIAIVIVIFQIPVYIPFFYNYESYCLNYIE